MLKIIFYLPFKAISVTQYIDASAWKVTSFTAERQKPEKVLIYTIGS